MSNYTRKPRAKPVPSWASAMLAQAAAELPSGYIEIEVEGLTFRRLLCIYAALLRDAHQRTRDNMRSLFRPFPVH